MGPAFPPLQVVVDVGQVGTETLKRMTIGASLAVTGKVVTSSGAQQGCEVLASQITLLGDAPLTYPLQPKRHTLPRLRHADVLHLRIRTRTFYAVFRLKSLLSQAIHAFFQVRGFSWVHTPILTEVDAEGAGEVFGVTSRSDAKEASSFFFKKKAFLTVSGQLAGEAAAMGLGKIYTFGPTFRAEQSHTPRHLAEFWMVEPEMAFYDLEKTIVLAEALLKHAVSHVLQHGDDALAFLEQRLLQEAVQAARASGKPREKAPVPLRERLRHFVDQPLVRITYTEAVELLLEAQKKNPKNFVYPIQVWGDDLQREHEHYLTDHFGGGVVVTHYPRASKAFYMYQNQDGKTVDAMDILLPGIGEIIGGSAREIRLDRLEVAMKAFCIDPDAMDWYVDLRRYGSVPHAGFGLGLERLVLFVTGMGNVRDVIFFPRTPGQLLC
jgi:asparaginyl-tRNA synthetase